MKNIEESQLHKFKVGQEVETDPIYREKLNDFLEEINLGNLKEYNPYQKGKIVKIEESNHFPYSKIHFVDEKGRVIERIESALRLYTKRTPNGEIITSTTIEDILDPKK